MDKPSSQQQIYGNMVVLFIMRNAGTVCTPSASGSVAGCKAGRLACRFADKYRLIWKIFYRLRFWNLMKYGVNTTLLMHFS